MRFFILFILALFINTSYAADKTLVEQNVLKVASQYINAIACETTPVTVKQIVPLSAYTNDDNRWDAQYAVLWSGDIGCQGGSGTSSANLLIVKIGAGDFYYVDSQLSSPNIAYESPTNWVTQIMSYSANRLVLAGKTYTDQDPHCCPSQLTEFILDRDKKGNWHNIDSHIIPK